jgi:hypothetical protein
MSTSTTVARQTIEAGPLPTRGTLSCAANQLIPRRTFVQIDSNGRARSPATNDASGLPAIGVADATYDNRTNSAFNSGLDDALDIEVQYGVFGWDYVGTAPLPRQTVFVVDNQTVSLDSADGTRGIAGICSETRDGQCFVFTGPHVKGAAGSPTRAKVEIPILSALVLATGVGVSAAAPATSVPGTAIADTKSATVKWLAHATPAAFAIDVPMPADLDDTQDVVFHAHVSKSGATLADATKLTVSAFEVVPGALHDADVDMGGDTGAVVGNAAAKTVTELTLVLDKANVNAYPETLAVQVKPKAGTLGTDNLYLHAAWLEYTRK